MCFGSAFFADPDPGKNLNADPEGIRGVNGYDFFSFFYKTYKNKFN